jgi:hypothetical protein
MVSTAEAEDEDVRLTFLFAVIICERAVGRLRRQIEKSLVTGKECNMYLT